MNPAEAGNQFTIYNADKTLSLDIPAGNLDEIRSIGRMLFDYPSNSPIKVLLLTDGTEVTNDEMLQKFAGKVMSLPLQLIPQQGKEDTTNIPTTPIDDKSEGTRKDKHSSTKDKGNGENHDESSNEIRNSVAAMGLGATGAAVAAPAAISAVGFTSSGVAAGSVAAGIQASIGNVAAGSLFATMQSVGVVGLGATGVGAVALAGAGLGFGAYKLGKYVYKKSTAQDNAANSTDDKSSEPEKSK